LWQVVTLLEPTWVLDLHEGWGFSGEGPSMGSSVVVVPHPDHPRRVEVAQKLLGQVNRGIARPNRRFTLLSPGPAGSFARAVSERLAIGSFVFETTWVQPLPLRVAQQRQLIAAALDDLGLGRLEPRATS
jgi:hypothetical protein